MMFKQLVRLLRAKCFECHQLRLSRDKVNRLAKSLILLDEGKLVEALDVENYYLHRDWCAAQLKEERARTHSSSSSSLRPCGVAFV
jgi:hypothetical protein